MVARARRGIVPTLAGHRLLSCPRLAGGAGGIA